MAEDTDVYVVGIRGRQEAALGVKGQTCVPVFLTTLEDVFYAFVTVEGSETKRRSWDFVLVTCSRDCSESLRATLQLEMDVLGKVSD